MLSLTTPEDQEELNAMPPISKNVSGEKPTSAGQRALENDWKHIVRDWNDTSADFPDICSHALFEQQVERDPNAVAVMSGEECLTYNQLNQRANQVAHFLRKRGIGLESLVGVCMNRTPNLVVALLGVWKAGGAYVPLDASYPQARLRFMVEDAAVQTLLTEQSCAPLFAGIPVQLVSVDTAWSTIAIENTVNPVSSAMPSNLAYVMYTSGSTGKPKGAMILHRGLVNYLWWAIHSYQVRKGGSVPVHSSISFDLTVTSLFPALMVGGMIELLREDQGAQNLLAALRRKGDRNLVKITPAHLEALTLQLHPDEMAGMTRTFIIGGENLLAKNLCLWREAAPGTRLINEYGPTETVVGCCAYEVRPQDPASGPVPIGRPIANTQCHILDEHLEPVPPGTMGELYIGGAGVARGYLNRADLTHQRFLPDPFSGNSESRMYKTGDLARYRKDGIIEYLGRVDNQVKIRGYRIELGEIEAALSACAAVQSCVVLAREDIPGNKQLVAYVVTRDHNAAGVSILQDSLKSRLPEYMIPSKFVRLDSLPLTANGKIDRQRLPPPVPERP
jgi:amino acid adenylation domain-containing protein